MDHPPFAARPLEVVDVSAAVELAESVDIHGIYVRNVLAAHPGLGGEAEILGLFGVDQLLGLCYFGPRGNLLVLLAEPLDATAVAQAILAAMWPWRIALAPSDVVRELTRLERARPLVDREQVYYAVTTAELVNPAELTTADFGSSVRLAQRKDLKRLMEAALDLNESDLLVSPWRVDKDWLKRSTKNRIRQGTTFVVGPVGDPIAKLDIGSSGPAGVVIEGVYTRPEARGQGYASVLVAAVAQDALRERPLVCLHVAADNGAARRAYEKCGMRTAGSCQLLLRE